jgi:hypothetical protein
MKAVGRIVRKKAKVKIDTLRATDSLDTMSQGYPKVTESSIGKMEVSTGASFFKAISMAKEYFLRSLTCLIKYKNGFYTRVSLLMICAMARARLNGQVVTTTLGSLRMMSDMVRVR